MMKFICRNCRGVGSRNKDVAIKELICRHKCGFMGLVETKHKELLDHKLRGWWNHSDIDWDNSIHVNGGGGVIASWNKCKFDKLESKKGIRWILIHGFLKDWGFECGIIVVYEPNSRVERKQLWTELANVRAGLTYPLLVMGDFNEVRNVEERNGGSSCSGSIREFKDWSDKMMIDDMPLLGRKFTWARGASRSRLDRMLFDHERACKFREASIQALANSISDHTPLLLFVDQYIS